MKALSRSSLLRIMAVGDEQAFLTNEAQTQEKLNRILQADMNKLRADGHVAKFKCETGRIIYPSHDTLRGVVVVTRME